MLRKTISALCADQINDWTSIDRVWSPSVNTVNWYKTNIGQKKIFGGGEGGGGTGAGSFFFLFCTSPRRPNDDPYKGYCLREVSEEPKAMVGFLQRFWVIDLRIRFRRLLTSELRWFLHLTAFRRIQLAQHHLWWHSRSPISRRDSKDFDQENFSHSFFLALIPKYSRVQRNSERYGFIAGKIPKISFPLCASQTETGCLLKSHFQLPIPQYGPKTCSITPRLITNASSGGDGHVWKMISFFFQELRFLFWANFRKSDKSNEHIFHGREIEGIW